MPAVNKSLSALYPAMKQKAEAIAADMTVWIAKHRPGCKFAITETFRSRERQMSLYAQGRTTPGQIVTQKNGTTNPSNHQTALAFDAAKVLPSGALDWNDEEFWQYYGHCVRAHGLTWGGDWKSPVDKPHAEWPTTDKTTYQKASVWKKTAGLI